MASMAIVCRFHPRFFTLFPGDRAMPLAGGMTLPLAGGIHDQGEYKRNMRRGNSPRGTRRDAEDCIFAARTFFSVCLPFVTRPKQTPLLQCPPSRVARRFSRDPQAVGRRFRVNPQAIALNTVARPIYCFDRFAPPDYFTAREISAF